MLPYWVPAAALLLPATASSCLGEGYLHQQLCQAWEQKRSEGVLQWTESELPALEVLEGPTAMVVQLAPNRGQKRSLNATINSTRLPFDDQRFHFGKVASAEVLLCFNPWRQTACHHTETSNTCHWPKYADLSTGDRCEEEQAMVVVNKHPICRNHFLLVPRGEQPQVLTLEALMLGLAFGLRGSKRLWLSFNTIGAGASVNHLHLHGFMAGFGTEPMDFPLERYLDFPALLPAATSRGPVSLWRTPRQWPLCGWVFEWTDNRALEIDSTLAERRLAEFVHAFVKTLQVLDLAHNVIIRMSHRQVIVFPRKTLFEQSKDVTELQVSGHEVLGWWVVARKEHALTGVEAEARLQQAQLPRSAQQKVLKALEWIGWTLKEEAKFLCDTQFPTVA